MSVIVAPDRPKMTLMDEVIPGVVSWPPGFKEKMDAWMLSFFGTTNLLKDGEVMKMGEHSLYVNPRTFVTLKQAAARL